MTFIVIVLSAIISFIILALSTALMARRCNKDIDSFMRDLSADESVALFSSFFTSILICMTIAKLSANHQYNQMNKDLIEKGIKEVLIIDPISGKTGIFWTNEEFNK
jgi:hypothetical protein